MTRNKDNQSEKKFFYRVKAPKVDAGGVSFANEWEYKPVEIGLVWAVDTKAARAKLQDELDMDLVMRSPKQKIGVENFFLLTLFELDDYWDKVWNGEQVCDRCEKTFTKLERDQIHDCQYIRSGYCSKKCEDEDAAERERRRLEDKYAGLAGGIHSPVIYKITNKHTGKCYIGQTTQPATYRWYQHFFQSSDTKFHKAITSGQISDWVFEVLEVVEDKAKMTEREQFWINEYNSIKDGYNSAVADKATEQSDNLDLFTDQKRGIRIL